MGWYTRISRFGDVHVCYAQQGKVSCGIACIVMAAFKVNKLNPGGRVLFSEEEIQDEIIKDSSFGPGQWQKEGLDVHEMRSWLNRPSLKMTGWKAFQVDEALVVDAIIENVGVTTGVGPVLNSNPVIISVEWEGMNSVGHWVLIDTIRETAGGLLATICDPVDGGVHLVKLESGKPFLYQAGPTVNLDFWGSRDSYDQVQLGRATTNCELLYRS